MHQQTALMRHGRLLKQTEALLLSLRLYSLGTSTKPRPVLSLSTSPRPQPPLLVSGSLHCGWRITTVFTWWLFLRFQIICYNHHVVAFFFSCLNCFSLSIVCRTDSWSTGHRAGNCSALRSRSIFAVGAFCALLWNCPSCRAWWWPATLTPAE